MPFSINVIFFFSEPPADIGQYNIYIATSPGNFTAVNGSLTLEQVNEKYWKVNKPLEMYYTKQKKEEKQ